MQKSVACEMSKEFINTTVTILLSVLLGVFIGYRTGARRTVVSEEVKLVRGETFVADVTLPASKSELRPPELRFADIDIPPDVIFPDSVDLRPTAWDWNIGRRYLETPFDDDRGTLTVGATVRYNRLQDLNVQFVPVEKIVTRYVERTWIPFVSAGYSTLGHASAGAGLFYKKTGFSLHCVYDPVNRKSGWGFGIARSF
jgi:hypothetical protein